MLFFYFLNIFQNFIVLKTIDINHHIMRSILLLLLSLSLLSLLLLFLLILFFLLINTFTHHVVVVVNLVDLHLALSISFLSFHFIDMFAQLISSNHVI